MYPTIEKAYDYLKSFDFILPYTHALSFCYLNSMYFTTGLNPHFQQHFQPFQDIKNNTFYCIEDMIKYTNVSRASAGGYMLGVSCIIIIGYNEDALNKMIWDHKFDPLTQSNKYTSPQTYCYDELNEMDLQSKGYRTNIYKIIGSKEFKDKYEIKLSYDNQDVVFIFHEFVMF